MKHDVYVRAYVFYDAAAQSDFLKGIIHIVSVNKEIVISSHFIGMHSPPHLSLK
jgi:hypothetical protein